MEELGRHFSGEEGNSQEHLAEDRDDLGKSNYVALEQTQRVKKSTGMYKTRAVIVFAVICTIVLKILLLLLPFVAA